MTSPTDDTVFASALEQADLIRRRRIGAAELVDAYLRRIDRLNPLVGAYFTVCGEEAMTAACAIDNSAGDPGPFAGVPLAVKDLTETAGIRTTHGSALFADRVPSKDDATVRRLKDAGFVILGKTSTPEFGWGYVTEPPAFPAARNPWDTALTPGGSSGGAAVALATGLTSLAQGTDSGGSLRVPAALCGVIGLKPTRGRVSAAPAADHPQAQNGPMGRTVADTAALLDVLAGPEPGDAWPQAVPERAFLDEVSQPPGNLRIAVSTGGATVAAANERAVEDAGMLLEQLGHFVEAVDPVPDWAAVPSSDDLLALFPYFGAEIARYPVLPPLDELELSLLDPVVRACLEAAVDYPATSFTRAWDRRLSDVRDVELLWDRFDVLLTPAVARPPLRIGEGRELPPEQLVRLWVTLSPFTSTWNLTGQPAVSVPFGCDEARRPLGIQLVGRRAAEGVLIRLAAQIEKARPWSGFRPPEPLPPA